MDLFEKFPSLTRFSHGWTITEKLDGSNGQILVARYDDPIVSDEFGPFEDALKYRLAKINDHYIYAGSRNRMLTADKHGDHMGFARFVLDSAEAIVKLLGEGRHFGEWVGKGIGKRGYNLNEKRFALFNTHRWSGAELPERFDVVPTLVTGYLANPAQAAQMAMDVLEGEGSQYARGFMNPEGVVMFHGPSKTTFKKTFDYDEQGKWAENQERKNG